MPINDGYPEAGQRVRVRGTDMEGVLGMTQARGFYLDIGKKQLMAWFVYFPTTGEVRTYNIDHLEIIS